MKASILSLFLMSLLSACGGSSGSSGTGAVGSTPTISPSLAVFNQMSDGIYIPQNNNCVIENNTYYKVFLVKGLNEFSAVRTVFSDIDCLNQYQTQSSTYIFVSATASPDGGDLTNLSLIDTQLGLLTNQLVIDFNAQNLFGYNSWSLGNPLSIIDRPIAPNQPILNSTGTIRTFNLKLASNLILLFNGQQFNKQ